MADLRRTHRAPLETPVEFTVEGRTERRRGHARDISLGGMFVSTEYIPAFGTKVVIYVVLPGERAPFGLPGIVRWTCDGMGVQFGLLGARETHAITEVVRAAEEAEDIKF